MGHISDLVSFLLQNIVQLIHHGSHQQFGWNFDCKILANFHFARKSMSRLLSIFQAFGHKSLVTCMLSYYFFHKARGWSIFLLACMISSVSILVLDFILGWHDRYDVYNIHNLYINNVLIFIFFIDNLHKLVNINQEALPYFFKLMFTSLHNPFVSVQICRLIYLK